MRICRVATVPIFILCHLKGQIIATMEAGHDVTVITSPGPEIEEISQIPGISLYNIAIPRLISLFRDLKALISLYNLFRKMHFDIVHSNTPKAGLLCAIATFIARIPIRIHTFTGFPWDESWLGRWIIKTCYSLIIRLNTQCYADSKSQRNFLISQGILMANSIKVIGSGSVAGVDLQRFNVKQYKNKNEIKSELSIPTNGKVITFIGRIVKSKGIVELIAGFNILRRNRLMNVFLVLVGPFEPERDPLPNETFEKIMNDDNIRCVGFSLTPEKYLAISDLLCLPSYREGFGNVVIEAAAMGVPSVATRTVGIVDTIVDGITGILVPAKDINALTDALDTLLRNDQLRHQMGKEAKTRAERLFDVNIVNSHVLTEYQRLSGTL